MSTQSGQLQGPGFARREARRTPREPLAPLSDDHQVAHQPRQPPVAIRKRVNLHEPMVESNGEFVGRIDVLV